jgi:hypothetical protein
MTATTRFERSVTIHCERPTVHAELEDPRRQLGLHPLLLSVTERDGEPNGVRQFEAVEVVRILGWIRWANRIRVRVESIRPGEVIEFEARSFPGIVVRSRFTLESRESETHVHEDVRIDSPRLFHGFAVSEAVRAQERLLANLRERLEARSDAP